MRRINPAAASYWIAANATAFVLTFGMFLSGVFVGIGIVLAARLP